MKCDNMDIVSKNDIESRAKDYIIKRIESDGPQLCLDMDSEVEDKFNYSPETGYLKTGILNKIYLRKIKGVPKSDEKIVRRALKGNQDYEVYYALEKSMKEINIDNLFETSMIVLLGILFFLLIFLILGAIFGWISPEGGAVG